MIAGLGDKIRALFSSRGYTCDSCDGEVFDYPARRLCAECENALVKNDRHTCKKCGRKSVTEGVCLTCKKNLPEFTKGYSPLVYEGIAASLVNRFKNGDRYLSDLFGERMAEYFRAQNEFSHDLLVTFVPMTEEKRIERGYNQAEELAKTVSGILNLEWDGEILQKRTETAEQKRLTGKERLENVQTAFHVHKRKSIRDRNILLIDDIMTTGATGSACARVLKNAGAKEVLFLTAVSLKEQKSTGQVRVELR